VFVPDILKVIGVGPVSPGAELGVLPGVIVNVHVSDAAIEPQLDGLIVVPLGSAGEGE
jgi:hypothetical protein